MLLERGRGSSSLARGVPGHVPVSLHHVLALVCFSAQVQGGQDPAALPCRVLGCCEPYWPHGWWQGWGDSSMGVAGTPKPGVPAGGGAGGSLKRGPGHRVCLPGLGAAACLARGSGSTCCLHCRPMATRWCRSPGLGQLRHGGAGSLPCLRRGPSHSSARGAVTELPQHPLLPVPPSLPG